MTKPEIQAASKFWSVGPGKAVMERWPVEWGNNALGFRLDFGPFGSFRLCRAERGGDFEFLRIELLVTAVHTIHGHYLDLLAKAFDVCRLVTLGSQGVVMGFYNLDDGEESEIAVNGSTLHEALAAAMEAAFGEPT